MKRRLWPDFPLVWQAALVVLPVVVLSGVALYYLREDKASVEQEARTRAAELAPELAQRLGEHAAEFFKAPMGGSIQDGRITAPVDYPRVPEPPGQLTPDDVSMNALWDSMLSRAEGPIPPNFVQWCINFSRTDAHTA